MKITKTELQKMIQEAINEALIEAKTPAWRTRIPGTWSKYYIVSEDQESDGSDMACNNGYEDCDHIAFVQLKPEYDLDDYAFGELVNCNGEIQLAFCYGYGKNTRCVLHTFDEVEDAIKNKYESLTESKNSKSSISNKFENIIKELEDRKVKYELLEDDEIDQKYDDTCLKLIRIDGVDSFGLFKDGGYYSICIGDELKEAPKGKTVKDIVDLVINESLNESSGKINKDIARDILSNVFYQNGFIDWTDVERLEDLLYNESEAAFLNRLIELGIKNDFMKELRKANGVIEEALTESNKRDDIDADRDDKIEKAKAKFDKKRDDADSDKDYKMKKAKLKESNGKLNPAQDSFLDYLISSYTNDRSEAELKDFLRDLHNDPEDKLHTIYFDDADLNNIKIPQEVIKKYAKDPYNITTEEDEKIFSEYILTDEFVRIVLETYEDLLSYLYEIRNLPSPWNKYYEIIDDEGFDKASDNYYPELRHAAFVGLKPEYADSYDGENAYGELVVDENDESEQLLFAFTYGWPDVRCVTYTFDEIERDINPLNESKKGKRKSIGKELKDDQEWIDYDMKHNHRISKATQKDIKDQGLQIEKDQYGDYEVAAGHYDESLDKSDMSTILDALHQLNK